MNLKTLHNNVYNSYPGASSFWLSSRKPKRPLLIRGYIRNCSTLIKQMKYWNIIFCILGILPLGFVIPILLFYFHAGQLLGRLPRYNQPDPKELDIYSDYSPLVDLTGKIWLISFPVWLILTITYLIFRRKHIQWTPIAISGALQLLGIIILLSGIFQWYID